MYVYMLCFVLFYFSIFFMNFSYMISFFSAKERVVSLLFLELISGM